MTENSWMCFPQTLVQKINNLLNVATPNPHKAFQLFKLCQRENLYSDTFESFSTHLHGYFLQSFRERAKSHLDSFLDRPLDRHLYDHFSLTFRSGVVSAYDSLEVSNWTSQMLRENLQTDCMVTSADIISRTIDLITKPPAHEKDHSIEFEDFCIAWKKIVFSLFGHEFDSEMRKILKELRTLQQNLKNIREMESREVFRPSIYLTQTEIDWTTSIQKALQLGEPSLPDFPLSRGPQKDKLIELEKAARLYNLIEKMKKTGPQELIRHREDLRQTIFTHCHWLLTEKAR